MVNRGEEEVWVQMNVVPRSTGNTNSGTRELTLKCKLKCYFKPMNNPLGVHWASRGRFSRDVDRGYALSSMDTPNLSTSLSRTNNLFKFNLLSPDSAIWHKMQLHAQYSVNLNEICTTKRSWKDLHFEGTISILPLQSTFLRLVEPERDITLLVVTLL